MIPIEIMKHAPMAIIWNLAALISWSWSLPNDELALKNELIRLESSWSSLDSWLDFWTLIVVVGVAVELVVIAVEHRHAMHDFGRGVIHPPDRPSTWLLAFGLLGAGLVASGVAGEFSVHIRAGKVETEMRDATGKLVAIADQKAGEATARASANDVEVQHLKSENLQLEALIAPRSLSLDQQKRIAEACGEFKGHAAIVQSYGLDAEGFATGSQIIGVLRAIKVVVSDDRASAISTGPMEAGIHVRTTDASEAPFASCFAGALNRIGKLKTALNDPYPPFRGGAMIGGGQSINGPHIIVMVGTKPLPLLMDEQRTKSSK